MKQYANLYSYCNNQNNAITDNTKYISPNSILYSKYSPECCGGIFKPHHHPNVYKGKDSNPVKNIKLCKQ